MPANQKPYQVTDWLTYQWFIRWSLTSREHRQGYQLRDGVGWWKSHLCSQFLTPTPLIGDQPPSTGHLGQKSFVPLSELNWPPLSNMPKTFDFLASNCSQFSHPPWSCFNNFFPSWKKNSAKLTKKILVPRTILVFNEGFFSPSLS